MLEPTGTQKSRRDKNVGAIIFAVILVAGFWALRFVLRYQLIPGVQQKHLEVPVMCVYVAAFLLILWAGKYLDIL